MPFHKFQIVLHGFRFFKLPLHPIIPFYLVMDEPTGKQLLISFILVKGEIKDF